MRKLLLLLMVCLGAAFSSFSQCTTAGLNWDALDYFPTGGYTGYSLSGTMSPNQSFAFGKNRLTITYTGLTSAGENGTHTLTTPSYGSGDDVQYKGDGTVTLTFASEVSNLKFSVYDIDMIQKLQITASNAAGVAQNIAASTLSTSTILTVAGNNSTNVQVSDSTSTTKGGTTSYGTVVAASAAEASINVDIVGPVKSVTLTTSNTGTVTSGSAASQEDGSFWLSDILACITSASFPTNYYSVSQPFTGMPGYVLVAINNAMYMVDPATGKAKLVFTDGASSGTINSLAYDPYNKVAYFCWSLTNNGSTTASSKVLRKYDFTTGNVTSVANDVNTIGIPTFNQGSESGAAAYYDGALYLGIEGGVDDGNGGKRTTNVGRESIIWRLDFDNSGGNPVVTQAYGVNGDAHDWSDFSIKDGMLYDFNGDATSPDYHHFNLQTGANQLVAQTTPPKQSAVGWDGTIYWVNSSIATYNMNGGTGTAKAITSTPAIPNWTGSTAPSFGDAAEAFRPAVDFGDAPIDYDPDPMAPALHEVIPNLRLGAATDVEWTKPVPGADANADGSDEDGLAYVTIMNQGGNYQTNVSVFNNTGSNATLIAWLDINGNKVFDATEGKAVTVSSSSTAQSIPLFWANTASDIPNNSYTYLRIRITSAVNNMTTANPSGYFPDGEVEDWKVLVTSSPLAVKLISFDARKTGDYKVDLAWEVKEEEGGTEYELQRSEDQQNWATISTKIVAAKSDYVVHNATDENPLSGISYYRLKAMGADKKVQYSDTRKVIIDKVESIQLSPNPASTTVRLSIPSVNETSVRVRILDMSGRIVYERSVSSRAGRNTVNLPVEQLRAGVFQVELIIGAKRYAQQLIVRK